MLTTRKPLIHAPVTLTELVVIFYCTPCWIKNHEYEFVQMWNFSSTFTPRHRPTSDTIWFMFGHQRQVLDTSVCYWTLTFALDTSVRYWTLASVRFELQRPFLWHQRPFWTLVSSILTRASVSWRLRQILGSIVRNRTLASVFRWDRLISSVVVRIGL